MPVMHIKLDGEGLLAGMDRENIVHVTDPITITTLAGGMASGKPSVVIIIDLPDGRKVLAETSAELFIAAVQAIKGRYNL